MKIVVIALSLGMSASTTFAQGLVSFANTPETLVSVGTQCQNAPISGSPGSYYFGLLIAPPGTADPRSFVFTGVYATNSTTAGRIAPATYFVSGWLPGATMSFLVAGWSSSLGPFWNPKWLTGSFGSPGYFGLSTIGTGAAGDIEAGPPLPLFGPDTIQTGFNLDPVSGQSLSSYTVTIYPGWNLIANQLDATSGNNIQNVIPITPANVLPDGSMVYRYDRSTGSFQPETFDAAFSFVWMPGTTLLNPGDGLYFFNPTASTFCLRFVGFPHTPVLPIANLGPNAVLIARQTNDVGTVGNILGFTPTTRTVVYRFNAGNNHNPGNFAPPDYSVFYLNTNGVWSPGAPSFRVGESVWLSTNASLPVISAQPTNQAICIGNNATFSVTVTGTGPMAFQWRFNGVNINSATNSSYTILNAQPFNVGSYSVQVVNGFGTTPSSLATLSFIAPTIACPGNVTTNTAPGLCSQVVIGLGPTFGDNCPGSTLAYALSGATTGSGAGSASGKTFNKGLTTVRYTVTDAITNSATCSFTVRVNDHENPTITCPGNVTTNTGPGLCSQVVIGLGPTFGDNCPGSTLAYALSGATTGSGAGSASGKTFNKGLTTVRYTVTDASSNSATCSFTVAVNDHENPTIACPGNVTTNTAPGLCSQVVIGLGPTFGDNCPGSTLAYALSGATSGSGAGSASGKTFNKGLTTVRYTVTDASSNSASCSFTVTVNDHENPTIACPGNVTTNTAPGLCSQVVIGLGPTFGDNCPGSTLAYALSGATTGTGTGSASGKTFNKGLTTVRYTVTDASSNSATCSFTVAVNDHEDPTIACPGNVTTNTAPGLCSQVVIGLGPTFGDNCPGSTLAYVLSGATTGSGAGSAGGKTFNKGLTTVRYTVTDASSNSATCSFTVTVNDNENPTIACPGNVTTNTAPGLCSQVVIGLGPTFGDNCPGSTLAYVLSGATTGSGTGSAGGKTFNKGLTTVRYTVTDASSNSATCSFTVTVNDHEDPTIACPGNLTTNTAPGLCSQVVIGLGPTFGDNCPGSTLAYALSGATTGNGAGSAGGKTFNKGLTTVRYTVTDASSNSTTCSFTVTVNDNENPTIACPGNVTTNTAPGLCSQVVIGLGPTFGDNCPGSTLAYVLSGATTGSGTGSAGGKTFNKGLTTVRYTVTDASSNSTTCSITVTVNDNENPTIACPGNVTTNTAPGLCSQVVIGLGPTFGDNCPGSTLAYVLSGATTGSGTGSAGGKTFNKGLTTVRYTVTDASSNSTTCSITVTVNDNENPTIACPGNVTTNTAPGLCSQVVIGLGPTFGDNCPGSTLAYVLSGATTGNGPGSASGKNFNKGLTTVRYTVTDASSNSTTCSITVTVNDNENPTIACPGNVTTNTAPGLCSQVVIGLGPTFGDNCPGSTLAYVLSGATTGNGAGSAGGKTFNKGLTTVRYTVTDASSNSTTCSITVTVNDNENPTIACPGNLTTNTAPGLCSQVVIGLGPTFGDNCPGSTLAYVLSGATTGNGPGSASGKNFNKGLTTVQYTVTDSSGNSATCGFTVTVNDNEPPQIVNPANLVFNGDPGQCLKTNVLYTATATDNCDPSANVALSFSPPSGSTFLQGRSLVVCTATDSSGNSNSCTFTVTVAPVLRIAPINGPLRIGINATGRVKITWTAGTLLFSPSVDGTYAPVPGAISPLVVAPAAGAATFYRIQDYGKIVIAWDSCWNSSWVLEQCPDLSAPNWVPANQPIRDDGITKSVAITPHAGSLLFRLAK